MARASKSIIDSQHGLVQTWIRIIDAGIRHMLDSQRGRGLFANAGVQSNETGKLKNAAEICITKFMPGHQGRANTCLDGELLAWVDPCKAGSGGYNRRGVTAAVE